MMRLLGPALVIARRDFTAIVFTPTFLLFLLAPLLMLSLGAVGGFGAARVADQARGDERLVARVAPADAAALRAVDARLRKLLPDEAGPPPLAVAGPASVEQARALLRANEDVVAILVGPLADARVLARPDRERAADYLAALSGLARAGGGAGPAPIATVAGAGGGSDARAQSATAFGAIFAMFFLTLLLAGQAVGMLAEERGNKVIEILAAAVPLEAVFLGKLLGMLGVALLFIAFWGALGAQAIAAFDGSLPPFRPASGATAFLLLFLGYFLFAFLLFGAVFLGIGAQAGSMREIQMLSLPITIFQVAMFGLATAAAGDGEGALATLGAIFPFSSPFVMAARAATGAPAWQHVAALLWQALWLALTIVVAARLFRRGVLKSGGIRRRRR
jgi:ABC-2 type transport system permease protein